MTLRVLVLQNHCTCPLGVYEDVLAARGEQVDVVRLDEGDALPAPHGYDAIVSLGGGMSAYDDHEFPWLADERQLIRDVVRDGTPFWGVCLGAQLLAVALGADLHRGAVPEGGPSHVRLLASAADDPIFGPEGERFLTFQTHRDTFDLPPGAVLLGSTDLYPHQVFRLGDRVYGLQCHPEITPAIVESWIEGVPHVYEGAHGPAGPQLVREAYAREADAIAARGRATFGRFLDLAGGLAR